MTKSELLKLSRENLKKSKTGSLCESYDEAFIKGYELSEKRIKDLEKENAELKSQIEKMKNCYNCNGKLCKKCCRKNKKSKKKDCWSLSQYLEN